MNDPIQVVDSERENAKKEASPTRMRTAALLLGSAVFGGIAVALWNRRTLAKMQNRPQEEAKKILTLEDDAIY
jgi:hypothetical protein